MPQNFSQSHTFRAPQQTQSTLEEKISQAITEMRATNQTVASHTQAIANLQTQVGQITQSLNQRNQGSLPSQPVENPKGQADPSSNQFHEQVKSVTTLRSGRILENHHEPKEANNKASQQPVSTAKQ